MEELFDTYDVNGKFLGIKPKSFCHSKNCNVYHKPVWVWIISKTSKGLLVQKRSKTKKYNPSKWDIPSAGHVDAGETCLQACVRETMEELGIKTSERDFEFLTEWLNEKGKELAQVYLLKTDYDVCDMKLDPQ